MMGRYVLEFFRLLFALFMKAIMPFVHVEDPVAEALEMLDELGGV